MTLTSSSLQANLHKDIADIEREWETIWEIFPDLSENPIGEPATTPRPSSSSISHTNNSSRPHHTFPLFPTPSTPTPTLTPHTIYTTPTPPHHPQPPSPLSHSPYLANNHVEKRKKTLLAPYPQPPPQRPQAPRPSTRPYLLSCPKNYVPKAQKNPLRSQPQRETHPHSG